MEQMICYGCMKPKTQTPVCEHCGFDDRKQNAVHQLPMGTVLQNQYVVGRVLGQGGFGITYVGWDRNLAIPVAIKEYFPSGVVLRQSTSNLGVTCYTSQATESFINHRERFLKEARTLAQLSGDPEIVQVRNFFASNNTAYIIMEYVQGITLKAKILQQGRRMSVQEVLDVMKPLMKALSKVHSKNLIHRDISPDNIMLSVNGGVKLIDFGTVRNMDNGMQTKATEAIMKPGFAPLEQYQTRGNLGTWTDVYALTATMHYCLTGKVPEDALGRLENGGQLTHLKSLPDLPPSVLAVLEKGLAVRISERYATVDEMYQALYGESIAAPVMAFPDFRQLQQAAAQQNAERVSQIMSASKRMPPMPMPGAPMEPTPMTPSVLKKDALFDPFKNLVSSQILRHCEEVSHSPILVETYLNQCVNVGKLPKETAEELLKHYKNNKPEPKKPLLEADSMRESFRDGTIFGRFREQVPAAVVEQCEAFAHKPILVETYLQQCVNMGRITRQSSKEMLSHYQNVPHPAPEDSAAPVEIKMEVPTAILKYCESVSHQPVLVETYLQQCINTGRISKEAADGILNRYKHDHTVQEEPGDLDDFPLPEQDEGIMYCQECGEQNPEGSKFCGQCGAVQSKLTQDYPLWYCSQCDSQIPRDSKYCRSCGSVVAEPVIRNYPEGLCQNCGSELMPDSKFCFNCGSPVQQVNRVRYCHNCGKQLTEASKFCASCGTPVNQ